MYREQTHVIASKLCRCVQLGCPHHHPGGICKNEGGAKPSGGFKKLCVKCRDYQRHKSNKRKRGESEDEATFCLICSELMVEENSPCMLRGAFAHKQQSFQKEGPQVEVPQGSPCCLLSKNILSALMLLKNCDTKLCVSCCANKNPLNSDDILNDLLDNFEELNDEKVGKIEFSGIGMLPHTLYAPLDIGETCASCWARERLHVHTLQQESIWEVHSFVFL
jgi:hypothetical protein